MSMTTEQVIAQPEQVAVKATEANGQVAEQAPAKAVEATEQVTVKAIEMTEQVTAKASEATEQVATQPAATKPKTEAERKKEYDDLVQQINVENNHTLKNNTRAEIGLKEREVAEQDAIKLCGTADLAALRAEVERRSAANEKNAEISRKQVSDRHALNAKIDSILAPKAA